MDKIEAEYFINLLKAGKTIVILDNERLCNIILYLNDRIDTLTNYGYDDNEIDEGPF